MKSYDIEVTLPRGMAVDYTRLRPTGMADAKVRLDDLVFDAYLVQMECSTWGDTRISLACTGEPTTWHPTLKATTGATYVERQRARRKR